MVIRGHHRPHNPLPTPERILLVRLSHLGDVVHALPVFHGLRESWPEARIGWAVQAEFAPLIQPLEGLERTFLFNRHGGPLAWVRLRRELREWRPDWTVDIQGNCKSAGVSWCSGAARRTGPARQDWQEPFCDRVSTERAPAAFGPHAIHRMLALMECTAPNSELSFDLQLTEAERRVGREAFEEHMPPGDGPAWILNLGVPRDRRTWPAERQGALARRLADEGCRVLLLSGPREASAGRQLADSHADLPAVAHWVGQRGLRALAGFLAAAAEAGARMLSGDSGPAHLAAASGVGLDLLAGPQDPSSTGPWPPADRPHSPHRLLRANEGGPGPMDAHQVEAVASWLLGAG